MSNPYKPFSTSWSAWESDAGRRGQTTGTAYNAQVFAQHHPPASPIATGGVLHGWPSANGGSNSAMSGVGASSIRGAASLSLGVSFFAIIVLVIAPASVYAAALGNHWGFGVAAFLGLAVLLGRAFHYPPLRTAMRWVGRVAIVASLVTLAVSGGWSWQPAVSFHHWVSSHVMPMFVWWRDLELVRALFG